jgi:hypothetical protein
LKFNIDNKDYNVIVEKKANKNTYIRVKSDLTILVTTHYLVSKKQINELLIKNESYLRKMIEKRLKEKEKELSFYYLGQKYDIIIVPTMTIVDIDKNRIFVGSLDILDKWYRKQIKKIFNERLEINYSLFEEKIPYPKLKIRKMKTRWGVCNRKSESITLNSELIKMDLEKIDYVIIHELAHLVHFNHSTYFWEVVSKYSPNYKRIRKSMKE